MVPPRAGLFLGHLQRAHTEGMAHTTKKDLTAALRPLSKATLKLLAVEVGCVVHRHSTAVNEPSAAQLAQFLVEQPIPARRAVTLLRERSTEAAHHALAKCIEGVKGCGALTVGEWTLTPQPGGVACTKPGKAQFVCHSSDPRVGPLVLDSAEGKAGVQLEFAALPKGVKAGAVLLLGPDTKKK